jgi:hypothetical protein
MVDLLNINGSVDIKDNFENINTNDQALKAGVDTNSAQLIEILNETNLDPNKDPEVTNARNSSVFGTSLTVKERLDLGDEFNLISKMLGGGFIINGGFDVSQRGTSFVGVGGVYTLDRWTHGSSNPTTISQIATSGSEPFNADYFMRLDSATSFNNIIGQHIESMKKFNGKKLTLSFYVKADIAGSAGAFISNFGGSIIQNVGYTYSTNWEKKEITFNALNLTTSDILTLFLGNSNTDGLIVDYANVKLELGDIATDFIPKTFAEELRDCQKYYYNTAFLLSSFYQVLGLGQATSTTTSIIIIELPQQMRGAPTFSHVGNFALTSSNGTLIAATTLIANVATTKAFLLSVNVAAGLIAGNATKLSNNNDVTAGLTFDAEL